MNDFKKISFSELSERGVSLENLPIFCRPQWFEHIQKTWPQFIAEVYLYQEKFLVFLIYNLRGGRHGLPFTDVGGVFPLVPGTLLDVSAFSIAWKESFPPGSQVFLNSGYLRLTAGSQQDVELFDYKLDLQSLAQISEPLSQIRKTLRHIVQTAPRFSIVSWEACDAKVLYKLYVHNIRQKANLALPYELFHALLTNPNADCLVAKWEGKIIGFSLFLDSSDSSHYFLSAVHPRHRQLQVAHHLLWHKIQSSLRTGKKFFLLGGTRRDGSLAVFKQGWGAVECPIYTVCSTPTDGKVRLRASRWRSLWRFIPLPLIPYLSKLGWSRIL